MVWVRADRGVLEKIKKEYPTLDEITSGDETWVDINLSDESLSKWLGLLRDYPEIKEFYWNEDLPEEDRFYEAHYYRVGEKVGVLVEYYKPDEDSKKILEATATGILLPGGHMSLQSLLEIARQKCEEVLGVSPKEVAVSVA